MDETAFTRIPEWAGPTVRSSSTSPYEARLTADGLHRIASTV